MQHTQEQIHAIFDRWFTGHLTDADIAMLQELSRDSQFEQLLPEALKRQWDALQNSGELPAIDTKRMGENILHAASAHESVAEGEVTGEIRRVPFMRQWWWAAASVLLVVAVGLYFLVSNKGAAPITTNDQLANVSIQPGGRKATLTLANGETIALESAGNGILAQQGNARVMKLSNGQIAYQISGSSDGEPMMNTMSTPRGGQYQLTLPDGTQVWLNAASSIIYPATFTGKQRRVKITGEAYFEVVKKKQQPFVVDIDGQSSLEVLGTAFNVNSFGDEGAIVTTLLHGSVKVAGTNTNIKNSPVILQPGQQAWVPIGQNIEKPTLVINHASIDQVMAWKNGLFNFKLADLALVMLQLSRWYDIQVKYEGPVPTRIFQGQFQMDLPLSEVLVELEQMQLRFKLEGRTLTVMH